MPKRALDIINQQTIQTFTESIQEVSDRGLHATELFLDFYKAYNVINNYRLLN
jgi:hypothetical protein